MTIFDDVMTRFGVAVVGAIIALSVVLGLMSYI